MREFAKVLGIVVAAGVLLAALLVGALVGFTELETDVHLSIRNAAGETINAAYLDRGDDDLQNFGQILPGQTVRMEVSPPGDAHYRIGVDFQSGKKLYLADPVYLPVGLTIDEAFEVQSDKIIWIETRPKPDKH